MKIDILNKEIFVIDYEQEELRNIESTGEFDNYIKALINNVSENETTRLYKTRRETTEVINCTKNIMNTCNDTGEEKDVLFDQNCENIAMKLLSEEIKMQERISQLRTSIKKGSLIEVLLYNSESKTYSFLLAKVEHKSFIDEINLQLRKGYSIEDNKLWKSCLFNFENSDGEFSIKEIKVFLDNNAKYWTDSFLEIDPMNDDDMNTNNAYRAIETTLNRSIKKLYPKDYTTLRNSVICFFRSKEMFNFDEMYETIFNTYNPIEMENDVYKAYVKDKIEAIKDKTSFDNQFRINQKIITARVKKVYEVNNNIEINIKDGIENLNELISAYQDVQTGNKYIRIKTNNDETYNCFKNR